MRELLGHHRAHGLCEGVNSGVGLDPSVGFLHDFSDYQTKQSLIYDLQEPFRWLVDISVIQAFESRALELSDFYFTGDDYRYRFEAQAKQRFIDLIRDRFNAGVTCKGRLLKWDTVIEQKTSELGRFLSGKQLALDFIEPAPKLERQDDNDLRAKILDLSAAQAGQLGISKSTLHCLRKKAAANRSFAVYSSIKKKLEIVNW
ncbi:MAG: CRISPR-associated endonuclease Cas1 [Candidatus Bathyarchaeia archaeon]